MLCQVLEKLCGAATNTGSSISILPTQLAVVFLLIFGCGNVRLFYSTNKASRPTRQVKCVAICAQTPYLCVQAAEGCSRSFLLATHMRSWTWSWVLIWDNHKDELLLLWLTDWTTSIELFNSAIISNSVGLCHFNINFRGGQPPQVTLNSCSGLLTTRINFATSHRVTTTPSNFWTL